MEMNSMIQTIAQSLPGFLLAVVAHEWAHGKMAMKWGDDTAHRLGRVSFNPTVHIDMFGTVIMPLICLVLGGAIFGWAKPVPIDPRRFKNYRQGVFWVSFAGPLANFILGTISAFLYAWIAITFDQQAGFYMVALKMLQYSIFINFLLGAFNLIPLPPLDGSKMVSSVLKGKWAIKYDELARYTPMIFMVIFALSLLGYSTIGRLLTPAIMFGNKITMYFLQLLS
jgi:Zn-dependent protease